MNREEGRGEGARMTRFPGISVVSLPSEVSPMGKERDMEPDRKVDVLLVDDQPNNLLALEAVLGGMGLNLVMARSGADALRRVLDNDFAVILMDVQMPSMDGFETAGLIRERDRSR